MNNFKKLSLLAIIGIMAGCSSHMPKPVDTAEQKEFNTDIAINIELTSIIVDLSPTYIASNPSCNSNQNKISQIESNICSNVIKAKLSKAVQNDINSLAINNLKSIGQASIFEKIDTIAFNSSEVNGNIDVANYETIGGGSTEVTSVSKDSNGYSITPYVLSDTKLILSYKYNSNLIKYPVDNRGNFNQKVIKVQDVKFIKNNQEEILSVFKIDKDKYFVITAKTSKLEI
jgi:hypothetical protein